MFDPSNGSQTFEDIFSPSIPMDGLSNLHLKEMSSETEQEEFGLASLSPGEDERVESKKVSRSFSPVIGDTSEEALFFEQQISDSPFGSHLSDSPSSWNPTLSARTFSPFQPREPSSSMSSNGGNMLNHSVSISGNFEQLTRELNSLTSTKEDNGPSFFGGRSTFGVPYSPRSSGEYSSPLESLSGSGGSSFELDSPKLFRSSNSENEPTMTGRGFIESIEHPLGEHPSRTLFVRNIHSNVDDEELRKIFEQYGPIRNMYTQAKHRGFVMISYFDIRHAKNARRCLQGKVFKKRPLDIHYSIPKDNPSEKESNQGTLVVFNLDPTTTNKELKEIFGKYGQIKEIRETPNKKQHKFIEFFDVRAADKAMKALQRTEIRGNKIKIEPSKPGGSRKSTQRTSGEYPFDLRSRSVPTDREQMISSLQQGNPYSYPPPRGVSELPIQNGCEFDSRIFVNDVSGNGRTMDRFVATVRARSSSHSEEDKYKYALNISKVKNQEDLRTTLCIRNIPNKYTQELLLNAIDDSHQGRYDFFYLPIDFKNGCNLGFAFINFINQEDIVDFYEIWNNRKWDLFHSEKVCEIAYARIQGKEALLNNYIQKNPSMIDEKQYRPALFFSDGSDIGKPEPFPMHLLKNSQFHKIPIFI